MGKYRIADMNIIMENSGDKTEARAEKYLYNYNEKPDFELKFEEFEILDSYEICIEKNHYKREMFPVDDFKYGFYGIDFAQKILEHNGCVLHSSAVAVDGNAYLFSAHSGTGKSTHTSLWLDYFKDRAVIINDDKPCIREVDGELYVYGTPWSGKDDISVNDKFKLKAITFICRSEENWIREASKTEAISLFLTQTRKPKDKEHMELLLNVINKIFAKVKIYKMGCNISEDAAKLSYETMSKN